MQFRYRNVCLEALSYALPDQRVTSAEIESRLAPLYRRLHLREGRLELMSGIAERRFWEPGTLPSQKSIETAEKLIRAAGIDAARIGALIHASVCRDHLEPATACRVHQGLGLPKSCVTYDLSNACLGVVNGMVQVANMIELGQIEAGIVVGTESSRHLVETTIDALNGDTSLDRRRLKPAMASLTIGSGSAAVLLVDRRLSRNGHPLLGGAVRTNTEFCHVCQSGRDEAAGDGMRPLMWTDAETLLNEAIRLGLELAPEFLRTVGWTLEEVDKIFCHQVGRAYRQGLLNAMGRPAPIDYSTVEFLGNTGSVALPITAAIGIENGHVKAGDRVALLGMGSGINALILGLEWQA
jgi:3-oxoacyl-[acyl-carrier-protein] synthase-3